MSARRRQVFSHREVLVSFLVLVMASTVAYSALWHIDFGSAVESPLALFRDPGAAETFANLGDVTVGILGVALTVVTIIVELASNRYTPRITELFIRDPINAFMMSLFVCTAVLVLAVEMSLYGARYPATMVVVAFAAMILCLLLLIPYFAYVFDFLLPTRVVNRIQQRSSNAIRRVRRRGPGSIPAARVEVLTAIEQLGEIALNSVDKKDKGISIAALTALNDLAYANLTEKGGLPPEWFATDALVERDQDFVAMHPDVVRALATRRTWVDMKIFRQYQAVFDESLVKVRDIAHLIAIHTRRIAVLAAENGDLDGLEIATRFLNTYMRATLKIADQRSAYNLMNEYRSLGETLLGLGLSDQVLTLAERCKFYGQLAFKMKLPFILETTAYDLCLLLERAHQAGAPCHDALLTIFLDVDRDDEGDSAQEASLRGVRKAQIKLATYYLARSAPDYARRIYDDMKHEPPGRLRSIHGELSAIVEAEWWEVSDRGINFEYLPPERRARLDEFFAWFDAVDPKQLHQHA